MKQIPTSRDSQSATVIDQRYNFGEGDVGNTNSNDKRGAAFQSP